MSSMKEWADEMRAAGVRRARFSAHGNVEELELLDTIPAPPPFDPLELDAKAEPGKDPSLCAGVGCSNAAGWHGTAYCRAHGLSAAGVRS